MGDFLIAFSLENHKLTITGPGKGRGLAWDQWKYTVHLMRRLLEPVRTHKPPLKLKFIVNLHDRARDSSVNATVRVFSACKEDYYTNEKPIPNNEAPSRHYPFNATYIRGTNASKFKASRDLLFRAWFSLPDHLHKLWLWPFYSQGLNFVERDNVINWRGSTTGEWGTGVRFQMIEKIGGTDVHTLTDNLVSVHFAFVRAVQGPDEEGSSAKERYRFANGMKYLELQRNKYILDVDGNGATQRFPGLPRSGSVIFKSSRYREWYHGVMEPYKHYVPVSYDISDLVEKVAWVHAHPAIAQSIALSSHFVRPAQ
ncbi:KDEL motif-containing protein 1 [Seminavis robusta]|uniref:KDEL motif-containing protein 1 n=1 Tax=Seminavis robusta TaxID=568900 RepID=A0A9N8EU35_9STRA|nr:KDEL motif-containing protein 1 [Seminavis robusta]|eukprot:Sro1968_g308440.1 KDEL motif-containing protein 1 (312) ;mRNA; r:14698-15754